MNKTYARNIFISIVFLITLTSSVMYRSGPSAGLTGAAITGSSNESNCTSCHSGTFITSNNSNLNKILLSSNFQGGGYIPDSTYTISLSFKQAGIARYGFEITCISSTTNAPVGTLTATNSRVQKLTATVGGNTRQYILHTTAGTDTIKKDSTRWTFTWKAPSSNVGKVKFYAAIVASNSNGNDAGDIVYGKSFEISPSSLLVTADAYSIDSVVCANNNAQMTGKGNGSPTSWNWKFTGATPLTSTAQNPVVKFTSNGTQLAILTTKNAYGTSTPDTLKVTVKPSPTAAISNGTAGTICKGDSVLLTANPGSGVTYKWSLNNKTSRNIFVKDTGSYSVTVTAVSNGCAITPNPFKLGWFAKPTVALTKTLSKDSFCGQINETFTASGLNIDTVDWYVNNALYAKTKTLSLTLNSISNLTVYAIARSINNCKSFPSNTFSLKVDRKINAYNFSAAKTTSNINLKWLLYPGIDSVQYSLNGVNFKRSIKDTTLALSGLTPSTFYNITIRSFQKNLCQFSDTVISVRTNNCSNITYNVALNSRICLGESIKAEIKNLPKSKVSIAFNGGAFAKDTSYTFNPTKSDSLQILIKDSLSLSCPDIKEKPAYTVDTFPSDNGIYSFNASSCKNTFQYAINPLYQNYSFYKNNVLMSSGTSNQYNYTGLVTGDKLEAKIGINTCSKTIGTVNFSINLPANANFTFLRNWKTYTFSPADTEMLNYKWYINDTLKSTNKYFVQDMSAYNNKTAVIALATNNFQTCTDSTSQTVNLPNFLKVADINNYQLNIYPNPFNEQLEISTNLENYQLMVLDNLGRTLFYLNNLNNNQTIDASAWSKGLYHIVLSNEYLTLDRKLVKVQ